MNWTEQDQMEKIEHNSEECQCDAALILFEKKMGTRCGQCDARQPDCPVKLAIGWYWDEWTEADPVLLCAKCAEEV